VSRPVLRRTDKAIDAAEAAALLARARVVNLATVGSDGVPYVVPNLFVYEPGLLRVHATSAKGHFRRNIEASPRVGFSAYEAGEVYPYGGLECDTSISYTSVIGWGEAAIAASEEERACFFDCFMGKYADRDWRRPRGFYPRLREVTVFRIEVATITGKVGTLPGAFERWPAVNRTMSPHAVVPESSRQDFPIRTHAPDRAVPRT
jgi:nitroimidazol reductase NimA-like FMN-containing flavoprotein (pyridoxamine 5'-phosphate oxidase superfamily)